MHAVVAATSTETQNIRPFLKWAGNKYRIIERIKQLLPSGTRLIEPFAGSGAVFLNTEFERYILSDNNPDLISLYSFIKHEGLPFIRYCKRYFNGKYNNPESYYQLRERFNHTSNARQKAALFVYLNRHGYNGLCRYNAKGGYNVPFGRYQHPYFPDKEMLAFHHKAQRADLVVGSFETAFANSRKGDVIYCDPPYVPLSDSANFTSYSAGGFGLDKQQQLALLAQQAANRGIPVLISNHHTGFTEQAYQAATQRQTFQVQRYISCNGEKRENAGEVLALFI